jgi:NADH-quinone oxidoreductase subunit M
MLLAFLALFLATKQFDFTQLAELSRNGTLLPALANNWPGLNSKWLAGLIFGGVFLGLAVKVPLVPLHTWLPTAYAEAPTGTTMLLTGLMSKMGVYGFLRILLPIFPEEMRWVLTPLLWACVISIVFSAGAAFAQRDLKRMLAYSSINHLGYCLLGISAVIASGSALAAPGTERSAALNGVLLQMFNHGLTAASLFWFVGLLEQRGRGVRGLEDFGGLRKVAPVFCGLMGIALFSSLGLPGLNGFVGEFLIFKGAFPLAWWAAAPAVLGLLITAIFILTLLQKVFNGPLNQRWGQFADLSRQERILVAPAIGLMFLLGIYPQVLLGTVNSTVLEFVKHLK